MRIPLLRRHCHRGVDVPQPMEFHPFYRYEICDCGRVRLWWFIPATGIWRHEPWIPSTDAEAP